MVKKAKIYDDDVEMGDAQEVAGIDESSLSPSAPASSESAAAAAASAPATTLVAVRDGTDSQAIFTKLHPIIFRLNEYEETNSLVADLAKIEFLELDTSIPAASVPLEQLLEDVWTIFLNARKQEAEKVVVSGNVETELTTTAIEIRHAVLHGKLETIDDELGMMVYTEAVADVQDPGEVCVVIVRREDRELWEKAIQLSGTKHPVCAVGNPGIGKTTTTLYLLQRLLVEQKKAVVYTIRRSAPQDDIFFEFTPTLDDERKVQDVAVQLHKMRYDGLRSLPVLQDINNVCVVDPGDYVGSCDASSFINAEFIMNASNDSSHWGDKNFKKLRAGQRHRHWATSAPTHKSRGLSGILIHGSLWTERQLLAGKPYLPYFSQLDDDELLFRFRMVGGSIRSLLEYAGDEQRIFGQNVDAALNVDDPTIQGLVDGSYQFSYKPDAPSSVLVGIGPLDESLRLVKVVLMSDFVEEQLAKRHLKISWYAFLNEDNSGNRGNIYESYLRELFSSGAITFPKEDVRESLRSKPTGAKSSREVKNYKQVEGGMTIGSHRKIIRVSNMIERAKRDLAMQHMFYSKNEYEPLIDMICRVQDGYDATQSTVSKGHKAPTDKIRKLKADLDLKDSETLRIFFAVPAVRYASFVTDPVNPLLGEPGLDNVRVFHVSISQPQVA